MDVSHSPQRRNARFVFHRSDQNQIPIRMTAENILEHGIVQVREDVSEIADAWVRYVLHRVVQQGSSFVEKELGHAIRQKFQSAGVVLSCREERLRCGEAQIRVAKAPLFFPP
jgi:hypothetical protein